MLNTIDGCRTNVSSPSDHMKGDDCVARGDTRARCFVAAAMARPVEGRRRLAIVFPTHLGVVSSASRAVMPLLLACGRPRVV